jgi:hypothetical protein
LSLHPTAEVLALFSSADLPWFDRLKIRRHLSACERCDHQLSVFRASNAEFKRQAATETLTGFEAVVDWQRLEREMQGNIIVGLAAARCVDKVHKPRGLLIKVSLASAMVLLFILGWVTHVPTEQGALLYASVRGALSGGTFSGYHSHESLGHILRSRPDGIVVGSSAGSLTILHPASAVISASGTSSVEARYIDETTGQVTITNVYEQ